MDEHSSRIAWGEEVRGLSLGISIAKNRYSLKEKPIILNIFIRNTTAKRVEIIETHVLREYEIELVKDAERQVLMTSDGEKTLHAARTLEPSRRIRVTIEPGTIYRGDWSVRLDEWFQLNEAATFMVRVRRRDWPSPQGLLSSGISTFSIA